MNASRVLEKDREQGWMDNHKPLFNEETLHQDRKMKGIIWEILENFVFEFPELSNEIRIKAKYFLHEATLRKIRRFPIKTYSFLNINMFKENVRSTNESMRRGYLKALYDLAEEG